MVDSGRGGVGGARVEEGDAFRRGARLGRVTEDGDMSTKNNEVELTARLCVAAGLIVGIQLGSSGLVGSGFGGRRLGNRRGFGGRR